MKKLIALAVSALFIGAAATAQVPQQGQQGSFPQQGQQTFPQQGQQTFPQQNQQTFPQQDQQSIPQQGSFPQSQPNQTVTPQQQEEQQGLYPQNSMDTTPVKSDTTGTDTTRSSAGVMRFHSL
jgi:hypothetical protein